MHPDQQRIALALLLGAGWTEVKWQGATVKVLSFCGYPQLGLKRWETDEGILHHDIPDYCNDLNAVRVAENIVNNSLDADRYVRWLLRLAHNLIVRDGVLINSWTAFAILHASSEVRVEALLRTFGRWKE